MFVSLSGVWTVKYVQRLLDARVGKRSLSTELGERSYDLRIGPPFYEGHGTNAIQDMRNFS